MLSGSRSTGALFHPLVLCVGVSASLQHPALGHCDRGHVGGWHEGVGKHPDAWICANVEGVSRHRDCVDPCPPVDTQYVGAVGAAPNLTSTQYSSATATMRLSQVRAWGHLRSPAYALVLSC